MWCRRRGTIGLVLYCIAVLVSVTLAANLVIAAGERSNSWLEQHLPAAAEGTATYQSAMEDWQRCPAGPPEAKAPLSADAAQAKIGPASTAAPIPKSPSGPGVKACPNALKGPPAKSYAAVAFAAASSQSVAKGSGSPRGSCSYAPWK